MEHKKSDEPIVSVTIPNGGTILIEKELYGQVIDAYTDIEIKRGAEKKVAKDLGIQRELVQAVLSTEAKKQARLRRE